MLTNTLRNVINTINYVNNYHLSIWLKIHFNITTRNTLTNRFSDKLLIIFNYMH